MYRLCAASGRRTVTGAPGEGTSDTGDCQSGPRSEHTGSEIAVSRVCVQWSVFMEYSLFMINQCCCTQSHELERRRSIQIMNLLKAVNSNQLSVFMTRPGLMFSGRGQRVFLPCHRQPRHVQRSWACAARHRVLSFRNTVRQLHKLDQNGCGGTDPTLYFELA